ncbi:MAG: 16S rRNA (guanine(527)-N(7))-methyltransferase RsmG, partial [Thermodesulfovibrionales bacterium]|nr:16S rRNA (guanine(527)-N(7))-methyltransferase RsmG [Thermodesulfovibrionales bacterium]
MAREVLINGLRAINIEPEQQVINAFETYLDELIRWNKTYNLTAITEKTDIVNKHFLDSLLYLKFISLSNCTICDLGSGAGFPGLPIAIVRKDANVTLVDSSRKKCSFLYHIRQVLRLNNVEVINKPIEQIGDLKFDYILSRAVFSSILELLSKCSRFLNSGGVIIVSKGEKGQIKALPDNYTYKIADVVIPNTNMKRLIYA